jgi:hypothetical protein
MTSKTSRRTVSAKKYPSFVDSTKPGGRCWWKVKATGNYEKDCHIGERLALEYLAYEERDQGAGCLQMIVGDMPRKLTGVEIAFLQMVCFAATTGAYRAREISKYWDRCTGRERLKTA